MPKLFKKFFLMFLSKFLSSEFRFAGKLPMVQSSHMPHTYFFPYIVNIYYRGIFVITKKWTSGRYH